MNDLDPHNSGSSVPYRDFCRGEHPSPSSWQPCLQEGTDHSWRASFCKSVGSTQRHKAAVQGGATSAPVGLQHSCLCDISSLPFPQGSPHHARQLLEVPKHVPLKESKLTRSNSFLVTQARTQQLCPRPHLNRKKKQKESGEERLPIGPSVT